LPDLTFDMKGNSMSLANHPYRTGPTYQTYPGVDLLHLGEAFEAAWADEARSGRQGDVLPLVPYDPPRPSLLPLVKRLAWFGVVLAILLICAHVLIHGRH
jgi:hypothetical protein